MFKRHVYTCPDVIHDRKIQKRAAYTILGVELAGILAFYQYGKHIERKELNNSPDRYDRPPD